MNNFSSMYYVEDEECLIEEGQSFEEHETPESKELEVYDMPFQEMEYPSEVDHVKIKSEITDM